MCAVVLCSYWWLCWFFVLFVFEGCFEFCLFWVLFLSFSSVFVLGFRLITKSEPGRSSIFYLHTQQARKCITL